ncbi:MAG: hypothetical protein JSR58_05800 [Verrucomicrobia bacterium]|nr:hypothetical protein [Verrucomicrobiota bacterium]
MVTPVQLTPLGFVFAVAIGASVHLVVAKVAEEILKLGEPVKEARTFAIASATLACLFEVYRSTTDNNRMVSQAFLEGILVSTLFLMWSHSRSEAKDIL